MIANLMGSDGLIFLVIALIVLVGGSQLPKIARNVGLAGKEFRKAQAEAEAEEQARAAKASVPPPAAIPPAPSSITPPQAGVAPATPSSEPVISLTPAQLEALLRQREEQARGETQSS
jgi:Sec-independent protein translocase protein TatA